MSATPPPTPAEPRLRTALAWRIGLTILLLILLLVLGGVAKAGAQSSSDPLVLAFYYTWFDNSTWTYDTLSDLPAQPYVSSDRAVMGRHIDQARGAGIDALITAWYGPGGGNQTEPNLSALLEEAGARNFRIGILFESDSPFMGGTDATAAALSHALSVHAQHPAYLRVDGKPVIFFWRTQRYSVETWRTLRSQVDPGNNSIWIADGVDTSYLSVFDGHHLYSNTWNPPANLENVNAKFAGQVEAARQNYGLRLWVATAMPGYNDVKVRGGFAQDREGGAYYERSWAAAINSKPNWVVITSFNEWPEGSYIEPSAAYGDQYLGLTAAYSAAFKSGGGAPAGIAALSQPAPVAAPAAALPAAEVTTPTLFVETALLNVRGAPAVSAELLQQVAQGTSLAVTGRSSDDPEWWQVDVGGRTGWVNNQFVRAAGPMEGVPQVATLAAQTIAALAAPAAAVATLPGAGAWRPVLSPRP